MFNQSTPSDLNAQSFQSSECKLRREASLQSLFDSDPVANFIGAALLSVELPEFNNVNFSVGGACELGLALEDQPLSLPDGIHPVTLSALAILGGQLAAASLICDGQPPDLQGEEEYTASAAVELPRLLDCQLSHIEIAAGEFLRCRAIVLGHSAAAVTVECQLWAESGDDTSLCAKALATYQLSRGQTLT